MASSAQAGAPAPEALPRRFGSYLLFDRIGRGGMADIYLARLGTELGGSRRVVVKEILPHLARDPRFARSLIDEAKLVAGLRHANIAQVIDLGREGERLFIAMEYVEGFDLNHLLRRLSQERIALPAEFALRIVRETLAALDFAHRATDEAGRPLGIVHRDVSPSNVLVSLEGEVRLCDFGIAKALEAREAAAGGDALAESGEVEERTDAAVGAAGVIGKAAYMSPEQARGESVDPRSDVFSIGILLWELCAGRRLYRGNETQMLELAREGAVPPLPDRGLAAQADLQAILDRALAFEPSERWASAADMMRALDDYVRAARLFASQLRFAAFLTEHFEEEVVRVRRERERAAEALDRGPAVELVPMPPSEPPPAPSEPVASVAVAPASDRSQRAEGEVKRARGDGGEQAAAEGSEAEGEGAPRSERPRAPAKASAKRSKSGPSEKRSKSGPSAKPSKSGPAANVRAGAAEEGADARTPRTSERATSSAPRSLALEPRASRLARDSTLRDGARSEGASSRDPSVNDEEGLEVPTQTSWAPALIGALVVAALALAWVLTR
jgi:serine/threonine-protein kinase